MNKFSLGKTIAVLFFFFIFISSLYFARQFLIPIAFGGLLAIIFTPLAKWFETRGLGRTVSSLICVFIFLTVASGLVMMISLQVSSLSDDITIMQQRESILLEQVHHYVSTSFGVPIDKQENLFQHQEINSSQNAERMVAGIMTSLMNFLFSALLMLVYIFMFLFFRLHIKSFILKLVPITGKIKTERMINNASKVAQKYLIGTAWMLSLLWIMYTIGFSIAGVKYALFFALFCSLLELMPYIGSISGAAFTAFISFAQGSNTNEIIGIALVYFIIQIIKTYILEPVIVNREVNVNPLVTILVLVAGELIWGIPGLILAVPLLGVTKVFCDNIESLKPFGFLIGGEKKVNKDNLLARRLSSWLPKADNSEISSSVN